jgi:hypothetical protein
VIFVANKPSFDRLRCPLVYLAAPFDQQRVVGNLLRERVFESIVDARGRGLLVDKLGGLQIRQRPRQLRLRHRNDLPDKAE